MRSKFLLITSIAAFAIGCGAGTLGPQDTARAADTKSSEKTAHAQVEDSDLELDVDFDEGRSLSPFAHKGVGDFSVHRFSGSFTKKALTLTEEVRAKKGSLIIIDYTLEGSEGKTTLRVTHDIASDRVLRVRQVKDGAEIPSDIKAYEAMIEKTIFVPDSNDALIKSERGTCLVGGHEQDCDMAKYRVSVGEKKYQMSVSRSVDGADISGEVTSQDGKIIYKAELVESGKGGEEASFASRK